MGETYYDVLGVDPDATQAEIRSAYRDRVLETHPDHNDDPDAAEQFTRVSTAESVLGDETERARYDRLGHESYVRLADVTASADRPDESDGDRSWNSTTASERETTAAGRGTSASRTTAEADRTATGRATRSERSRDEGDRSPGDRSGRDRSHHARQRRRRARRTARRRANGEWPFAGDAGRTGERSGTATGVGRSNATAADAGSASDESGFSYAVHDWDDDVELRWNGHPLDRQTLVGVGCVTLLYPLFVYASLSPTFSVLTNAIVAACTLVLVGYLLTMPRVAVVAFGAWSVALPIGLYASPFDPVSIPGLVAIGSCWIPFGYAIALRRALQP